jgi:DNA-binding winged helix-turn-helix (wHTH) protein
MRLRIEDVLIDTDRRQVFRSGRVMPLSPKAYQLLATLVEARPKALSKDELYKELWPATFVVEANLSNLVGEIRSALNDSTHQPRFIRTVHGYGYAFCGEGTEEAPGTSIPHCWLVCGDDEFPLLPGENLVGRGPEARVHLDVAGVSRKHARIIVTSHDIVVEDLGSKNGTFVGGERIHATRELAPDQELSFGPVRAVLHVAPPAGSTESINSPRPESSARGDGVY